MTSLHKYLQALSALSQHCAANWACLSNMNLKTSNKKTACLTCQLSAAQCLQAPGPGWPEGAMRLREHRAPLSS